MVDYHSFRPGAYEGFCHQMVNLTIRNSSNVDAGITLTISLLFDDSFWEPTNIYLSPTLIDKSPALDSPYSAQITDSVMRFKTFNRLPDFHQIKTYDALADDRRQVPAERRMAFPEEQQAALPARQVPEGE